MDTGSVGTQAELIRVRIQLQRVFSPSAPISKKELFAGRLNEVSRIIGAVSQTGQHAVIYGERGVGKTSLASTVRDFWTDVSADAETWIVARVNCHAEDTFSSIWMKIYDEVQILCEKRGLAFPD